MKKVLRFVNLPLHISNHVIGTNHSLIHRRFFGVVVLFLGQLIHDVIHIVASYYMLYNVGTIIGHLVIGTGLIPFVEEHKTTTHVEDDPPGDSNDLCVDCAI